MLMLLLLQREIALFLIAYGGNGLLCMGLGMRALVQASPLFREPYTENPKDTGPPTYRVTVYRPIYG